MTPFNFDGYSEFCDWCDQNGYDPDTQYDLESEPHKRDMLQCFYLENSIDGSFASVSVVVSDQWGWTDITVQEGFEKKTIVTTKNVYKLKK